MTLPFPGQPAHDADHYDHTGGDPAWAGLDRVAGGDVVAGDPPVPITVWRALPGDATEPAAGGLATWLARRLVATYSRPGRTVVDFDNDPPLRHAAVAGRRNYLPLPAAGDLADLDHHRSAVDLITFRWPRASSATPAAVVDLFRACRMLLTGEGHTAVIVQPLPSPGRVPYVEHSRQLVPAARSAGMGYLQHIIAVLAPIVDDTLQPPPPPPPGPADPAADPAGDPAGELVPVHRRVHLDLLIFVVNAAGRG